MPPATFQMLKAVVSAVAAILVAILAAKTTGPPNDNGTHLGARGGWRTNHTEGILLRRDLHALMDVGKLQIIDGVVSVTSEHYKQFNGVRVW